MTARAHKGDEPRRVLCTGVSGFLGGHVALQLLQAGYQVRGSVRSLAKAGRVEATLASAGADVSRLEFVELDLLEEAGWAEAAAGCQYVIHTASPVALTMPKDAGDLIRPAVIGTRRAIEAGLDAGAKRIVLTSSVAAVAYGHRSPPRVFTARDWTDLDGPKLTAYIRSKTLAETEAWAMVQQARRRNTLAVINPGAILGPLLDDDPGPIGGLVAQMLKGAMPAVPRAVFGWVDVRDVAAAHLAAMEKVEAGGRRHIVSGDLLSLREIAQALADQLPEYRDKLPRFEMPDWLVRLGGLVAPSLRDVAPELGPPKPTDPSRAAALLGRGLIPAKDAAVATARSAIAYGLV